MEGDSTRVAARLLEYARAHLVAEDVALDEHTPLADAGIDSFCIVELLLFSEGAFGVRVPESALTHENLACLASLAQCIASLAAAASP